jgi:hypothetical protein
MDSWLKEGWAKVMFDNKVETAAEIELITVGAQRAWRASIVENLEIRFGEVSELTLAVIEQLENNEDMKLLHAQALRVDSIEEFNSVLAEFEHVLADYARKGNGSGF